MSYGLAYTPYNTNLFLNNSNGNAFDPDAQAFITAANITDGIQQAAINQFVIGLKDDNIWSKMKAIYPFVGGSAFSHKWNLKDPRDLDLAFRLVFSGGWTHDSNGVTPNGINAYANTYFRPAAVFGPTDYSSMSFYSRTNSITAAIQTDMAVNQFPSPTSAFTLFACYNSLTQVASFQSDFPNAVTYNYYNGQGANTNTQGFFCGSSDSANISVYKNNVLVGQNTTVKVSTRTSPTIPVYIGADNYNGVERRFSVKNFAFAHIGTSLENIDLQNLNSRVEHLQVELSREV